MLISPCRAPNSTTRGPKLRLSPAPPAALMLDATRRQPSGEEPVSAVRTVKSSAATPEKLVPETSRITPSSEDTDHGDTVQRVAGRAVAAGKPPWGIMGI